MSRWLQLTLAMLILAITLVVGRFAFAQAAQPQAPLIISGSDIGFRVDRQRTESIGKLSGAWVVRFNGQWVEPESFGPRPLSTR
jgi:hypothetical protein